MSGERSEAQFISLIQQLPKFGDGLGLLRVQQVLKRLVPSYPQFSFTPIVVTGSNGKGSTSHYTESLLCAAECRTGLFTSPHFLYFNERFRVNGKRINYKELLVSWHLLQKHVRHVESELGQSFGRFEILFLLAVMTFEQHQVQVAVFEAGIGGRYDPTRLLQALLCVLTSVDVEHKALLGDSIEAICYDKLDVCPTKATSFISATVPASLRAQIHTYNELRQINTVEVSKQWQVQLFASATQTKVRVMHSEHSNTNSSKLLDFKGSPDVKELGGFTELCTAHCEQLLLNPVPQAANIATAIAVANEYLQANAVSDFSVPSWLSRGLATLTVAGRMQFIQQQPFPILIDSAHTPESFLHLFSALIKAYSSQNLVVIVGLSEDKPLAPLIEGLTQLSAQAHCNIIATQPTCRGKCLDELVSALASAALPCQSSETVKEACDTATLIAQQQANTTVIVLGGLFLAAEAQVSFQKLDVELLFE